MTPILQLYRSRFSEKLGVNFVSKEVIQNEPKFPKLPKLVQMFGGILACFTTQISNLTLQFPVQSYLLSVRVIFFPVNLENFTKGKFRPIYWLFGEVMKVLLSNQHLLL